MSSVRRSASVKSTVPALNDDTPEVTVSPELDALGDDDARHGSGDPGPLGHAVARDRDAVSLDDLVALAGGLEALGGQVAPGHEVLQRLAPDEALVEEPLLGGELALGVLERHLGLRDARVHVRQRLGLRHVGLDLGQDVARLHDGPVADLHGDDAAGDDRLDVHLGLGLDDPDLADAHLQVLGLDLAEAEGKLVSPVGAVLAPRSEDDTPSRQDHDPGREPETTSSSWTFSPRNPIRTRGRAEFLKDERREPTGALVR